MRIPSSSRQVGLQFNITPLIDIVFLLIIFFLVASHFVRNENLEAVELPTAASGKDDPEAVPNRLTLTVMADSTIKVAGRTVTMDELPTLLVAMTTGEKKTRPEVRIRADRTVPWKTVEPIMMLCAQHGISNVKTAVEGE